MGGRVQGSLAISEPSAPARAPLWMGQEDLRAGNRPQWRGRRPSTAGPLCCQPLDSSRLDQHSTRHQLIVGHAREGPPPHCKGRGDRMAQPRLQSLRLDGARYKFMPTTRKGLHHGTRQWYDPHRTRRAAPPQGCPSHLPGTLLRHLGGEGLGEEALGQDVLAAWTCRARRGPDRGKGGASTPGSCPSSGHVGWGVLKGTRVGAARW